MQPDLVGDAAERATVVFLQEYVARAGTVPGLLFYWSYSILSTLLRLVELDRDDWKRRLEFLRAEFEQVPRCAAALSGPAG